MCNTPASPLLSRNTLPSFDKPVGSARRRLWDLCTHCHCPVVGVCLPLGTLRKILSRFLDGRSALGDYESHTGAVAACTTRNPISNALQRELDQRHALIVRQYRNIKSAEELGRHWSEALQAGDVAGAFWAGLTHGHCNPALEEQMCRDIHMLQHQAGADMRETRNRVSLLKKENVALAEEFQRAQDKARRMQAEKTEKLEWLETALMRTRAESIAKDTMIGSLQAELDEMRQSLPDLPNRLQLREQNMRLQERIALLERQNAVFRMSGAGLPTPFPEAAAPVPFAERRIVMQDSGMPTKENAEAARAALERKTVLCVGGREGNIAAYRRLIEDVGGQFSHHDGGRQDNIKQLDTSLAAADLVICQTGCISHNAYWRVKEHCKRTGTRCMFVENPSVSSLSKGIEALSASAAEDNGSGMNG
ncbi:DUF2325 domain-containing protein [Noviherbaspirillum sp. CPCC 100848]|uniref:DUF2325 domain-containing protein n=1 Tax=Noviherbaspirillum album TaxID=3080276 RepID=A0ABU6JCH5_9BURK|nr:DUF2325 domain-containing protein [Noviherbaspirillum sp. CPCC 100848]MEC4720942.1 DUF2325 domain-containing protein [Noviherbaspirillum sp. CPCC 100848]